MHKLIKKGILEILKDHVSLLQIPIRQKAKFEGWLKFELAYWLEKQGMLYVEVETKKEYGKSRTDITFYHDKKVYYIELKTANTNWKISGVNNKTRPITRNIQSIIDDAKKLNSKSGIVAFVLFPVPLNDNRWEAYLTQINNQTELEVSKKNNCELIEIKIDQKNSCNLVVCAFMSKRFRNW